MEPVSSEIEEYVRNLFENFPCHKREGMELVTVAKGEVVVRIATVPDMKTCYPHMQGGYMDLFADSPMWIAIMTNPRFWGKRIYTVYRSCAHFHAAMPGTELTVHARLVEEKSWGERLQFLSVADIKTDKGLVVATVTAVNHLFESVKYEI